MSTTAASNKNLDFNKNSVSVPKSSSFSSRWQNLSTTQKKGITIGISLVVGVALAGAIVALVLGAHQIGIGGKDFMNNKFVPLFKDHVGPALKSSAFKVAHFMNSTLTISGPVKVPVWALFASGLGLVLAGRTIPGEIYRCYQHKKYLRTPEKENLNKL